jgi:hypothetical protein
VALNWFSLLEMFDSLWFTEVGIVLMFPGWFHFLLTYWVVLLGFVYGNYGWYDPRLRVISTKLVTFKLWSTVIPSPYFLNFAIIVLAMR